MAPTKDSRTTSIEDTDAPAGTTLTQARTTGGVEITVKETSTTEPDAERTKILQDQLDQDRAELATGVEGRSKTEFIPRGEGFPLVETPVGGPFGLTYEGDKDSEKQMKDFADKVPQGLNEATKGPGDASSYNA